MSDIADRYRRHADAFEHKVAAVRPDQWSNRSPCEDWTAHDVVSHIIDMHGAMLRPLDRRIWSATTALPAELLEKFRTPGAFGPGVKVFGPEVNVGDDAPLQDRLLGLTGRDPR